MEKIRIQKLLSDAGVASRRAVEEMIVEGRITVNGELVNSLPCFVDGDEDEICVDDVPVRKRPQQRVYFLLNKPRGVVCTQKDPEGRPIAMDLVPSMKDRVYCVGGLDADSSGLVLLTNDGELTRRLTDPRSPVEMTYIVEVDGLPDESSMLAIKKGIFLDGRRTQGMHLKLLERSSQRSHLEIRVVEGKNRIIRRVFHHLGHKIRRMKRTAIGPVSERGLKIGHFRPLMPREVEHLRKYELPQPHHRTQEE